MLKGQSYPGCNMSTYPGGVNVTSCCSSLPKPFMNKTFDESCKTECPKTGDRAADMCCMAKCFVKNSGIAKADGTFDSAGAVAKLNAATNQSAAWAAINQIVVDKCVADGKLTNKNSFFKIFSKNIPYSSTFTRAIQEYDTKEFLL